MIIRKWAARLLVLLLGTIASLALLIALLFLQAQSRQSADRVSTSPSTGFYVDASDTRLFVQQVGAENAPAVIFIHGTGAWSEVWRPAMTLAASLGFRAIALDLPPFGYSLPPISGNYSKLNQARRILAAMDSLQIEKAIFVSHSIGSSPLMEALLEQPQRVFKLIMISPALGLQSTMTDGKDSALQTWLRKAWFGQTIAACIFTNPALTGILVKSFVSEKERVTEAWVALYRQPFVLKDSYQAIAGWLPELVAGRSGLISDQPESYGAITYPTILIWGEDDQVTPLSQGEYLQQLIPKARLITLHGGHVPMIEEPAQFSHVLAQALQW